MPWLALPYQNEEKKLELKQEFGVNSIPRLVVISNKDGSVIDDDAVDQVKTQDKAVYLGWLR